MYKRQLTNYDNNDPVSPSVLRRYFLDTAESLRVDQPVPFTVTASCLLLVGGMADTVAAQGANLDADRAFA